MDLIYEGSVKNLWKGPTEDTIDFEFTDAYSVFDWGRMPDSLPGKGAALAGIGAHFFQALATPGAWRDLLSSDLEALTSFYGRRDAELAQMIEQQWVVLGREGMAHHLIDQPAPNRLRVKRVNISPVRTLSLAGQSLYEYTSGAFPRFIPLEVVFRFGMPEGSSLAERLTSEYAGQLGFDRQPPVGSLFVAPIIEFFTKLESRDRFLTMQEALLISGLDRRSFRQLFVSNLLVAVFLKHEFQKIKLSLWDGKCEWAEFRGDSTGDVPTVITLVDSIGPDELRLSDEIGSQISKEFLRCFYRETAWYEATKKAKKLASERGLSDWKVLMAELGFAQPPALDESTHSKAQKMYSDLLAALKACSAKGGA